MSSIGVRLLTHTGHHTRAHTHTQHRHNKTPHTGTMGIVDSQNYNAPNT